jgi:pimeloyl-ACP methyl ester carboxylesterase
MPVAALNGIEIYFEREGEGPPVVFLNGSGATLAGSQMLLAPFRKGFDLLAHDQRALGRTTIPADQPTMADYAADAMALVDHVGWDRARVVGISFGGMVAQELAVTWPDRIERLALVCTSPGGAGGPSYPLHELPDLDADERIAIRTRILDTRFTPEHLAAHPNDQALVDFMLAAEGVELPADVVRGQRMQLEARRHHDVWDRLDRISCPTLVAAGRYDGIAPPANAEAIASRVPGAELRWYEGGHAFMAQDRAAFPDLVAFLAG